MPGTEPVSPALPGDPWPPEDSRVSLLDYISALLSQLDRRYEQRADAQYRALAEMDLRYQQRFDAQQKAVEAALLSAEKAVATAMTAAEKAVAKAEIAAEKRFDSVNEFRAQLSDQASTFMPRSEAEARWSALSEKVEDLKERVALSAGSRAGTAAGWGYLVGAASLAAAVVAIIVGTR